MGKVMQVVAFTDGRTVEKIAFDARGDTEESAALFADRMRENGWVPVKGSAHLVEIEDGVAKPFVARPRMRRVWQVG